MGENLVVSGNDPSIFQELKDPRIMGAIWNCAWSQTALDFSRVLVSGKSDNLYSLDQYLAAHDLLNRNTASDNGSSTFKDEIFAFQRLFKILTLDLLPNHTPTKFPRDDYSRVEHARDNGSDWHLDIGHLTLLSVPYGITTQYLNEEIPGLCREGIFFEPSEPDWANDKALSLQQGAVIVFKDNMFPHQRGEAVGLIHRRPEQALIDESRQPRLVVQYCV